MMRLFLLFNVIASIYARSSTVLRIEAARNFTQVTSDNGYYTEEHTVKTEDGFLLTVFRIASRHCETTKRPPVILLHGLLESADAWVDAGPGTGLAYLLADGCYDTWVGNVRGNTYARRHVHLDPDKNPEFWDWSFDEIAVYDFPATIDYVLDHTQSEKVNWIGFSQGCGGFYAMCDQRPEYCSKTYLKISIAPSTKHYYTTAIGFRKSTIAYEKLRGALAAVGVYEALRSGGAVQEFFETFCSIASTYSLCIKVLAILDGYNPGSIPQSVVPAIFQHFPAGTSVLNMARFGQACTTNRFQKFDYGAAENLDRYGTVKPPAYNLSAVTVPVVIIYGNNDGIVDKRDVKDCVKELPNVLEVHEVRHRYWTHLDNNYSRFEPELLFRKVDQYLKMYSYETLWAK